MKNPKGTSPVERGMFVERRPPETEQGDLLNNLAHGILIIFGRLGLVAVDQTGKSGMDHGVIGFF